jgi:hypothetical protein
VEAQRKAMEEEQRRAKENRGEQRSAEENK